MSIDELKDRLDLLLNNKSSFLLELDNNSKHIYDVKNIDKLYPTLTLSNLIRNGYQFEREYFNKFIVCVTTKKSSSWLINVDEYNRYDLVFDQKFIIETLFQKFTPNEKELDLKM